MRFLIQISFKLIVQSQYYSVSPWNFIIFRVVINVEVKYKALTIFEIHEPFSNHRIT